MYYKCKTCDQIINTKVHKKVFAKNNIVKHVKIFSMTITYVSYSRLMSGENSKSQQKKERVTYIYFDFACTHKSRQCTNCSMTWCGTFQHRPNLCAVHKICTTCMEFPVTTVSTCEACGKNERVCQGTKTTENF
ncbi:hypothetical protein MAR_038509 [Mya arenaria]|uniref:Uncharacterized protein n=1 Tax=Mya arenaria TaxID=6604 RepID=A0ABY7FS48_MYAAR|nr:hypothetical protein MAR_038509 [Mya arenaria]